MSKHGTERSRQGSPLGEEIAAMIATDGPLGVDRYMAMALGHPEYGYYMSRDPLGRGGDFITAPEVSQMFGELAGIWCAAGWQMMGAPESWQLIELGPGRGTAMSDMVRAASVMPGLREGLRVHMVETSAVLRQVQRETLERAEVSVQWHERLEDVPDAPSLIFANEFFDALPVKQLQCQAGRWHERMVGLDAHGELTFGLSAEPVPPESVPAWAEGARDGDIAEISAVRDAAAAEIGRRITLHQGAALLIDYGHVRSATGDTLQAIRKQKFANLLDKPGYADITSHVDFERLAHCLASSGATVFGPVTQAEFLLKMGLKEREAMLRRRADARQRIRLSKGAQRLVAGNEMGQLFKVLVASHPEMPKPAPFNVEMS